MKNKKQPEQLILFEVRNVFCENIIKYLNEKISEKQAENKEYVKTISIKNILCKNDTTR